MGKFKFKKRGPPGPNKQHKKPETVAEKIAKEAARKKKKVVHETPYPDGTGTTFATITQVLGGCRFRVQGLINQKMYQGATHIKRKRRKRGDVKESTRLDVGTLVLISHRDFASESQQHIIDIIYRYSQHEITHMVATKVLPRQFIGDNKHGDDEEEDMPGFVFAELDEEKKESESESEYELTPEEHAEREQEMIDFRIKMQKNLEAAEKREKDGFDFDAI